MKILLALDGSPCSAAAVREVIGRCWPDGTEVEVLSVAHAFPQIPDPMMLGAAAHADSLERTRSEAREVVETAARALAAEAPALQVTTKVLDGAPKEVVVDRIDRLGPGTSPAPLSTREEAKARHSARWGGSPAARAGRPSHSVG